jgi:hypothetical protein
MAIRKSDLYASIWASCDELRGGMDASQYKDYVLFMLFIKYISDKYGNSADFAPPVVIPNGASFTDMVALKGKSDIGDRINTRIIQPLIDANDRLARTDFPDFNDPNRLGEGHCLRPTRDRGQIMTSLSDDDQRILDILRSAVAEALDRKRRLGQYAVIWRDGQVVRIEPDDETPSEPHGPAAPRA